MKRFIIGFVVLFAMLVLVGVGQVNATDGLTNRYAFNTDASDSAGTNHGTLTNGASVVFDAERGSVLQLDGVNDYVGLGWSNVPGGPTDTSVFTIAAWVKIPSGDVAYANIAGIYGEYTSYWHPETGYTGVKNYFAVNGGSRSGELFYGQTPPGESFDLRSTSIINDGEWHHVAYVQNEGGGSNRKIYIDGTLDVSDNSPEVYGGLAPDLWAIGARLDIGSHRYFKGNIDDVRFYDDALCADDIASLAVPEPSTLVLLFMGVVVLLLFRRKLFYQL